MSDNDFTNFNQAMKLAELGFDYKTFLYYQISDRFLLDNGVRKDFNWRIRNKVRHSVISAPTLAQACKWLRSKDILIHILPKSNNKYMTQVWEISSYEILETLRGEFNTYEQAQSAGIDVALGMLKNKNEQQK